MQMRKPLQLLLAVLLFPVLAQGQEYLSRVSLIELTAKVEQYIDDMAALGDGLENARPEQLQAVTGTLNIYDTSWSCFFQENADAITGNPAMMELVVEYGQVREKTQTAIDSRKDQIEKTSLFVKSEKTIREVVPEYHNLESKAYKLSLVKQASAELERLQAEERLNFSNIQSAYQSAKEAAEINPRLKDRMDVLTASFIEIQNCSEKIQQMKFKPFLERAKDYLMSIAAISIIMMFFIFLGNYIKSVKTARESVQKMKDMLHKNDEDIPTI